MSHVLMWLRVHVHFPALLLTQHTYAQALLSDQERIPVFLLSLKILIPDQ